MKFNKVFAVALLALAYLPGQASFEMILAASFTDGRVHRYDGGTGAYLGSFGPAASSTISWSVVADQPRQLAYLSHSGRVLKYNYSTGDLLGVLNVSTANDRWMAINSAGTELYVPGQNSVAIINSSTGSLIRTISQPNFSFRSVVATSPTSILTFGTENGFILARAYNTTTGALINSIGFGVGSFALQAARIGGESAVAAFISDGNGVTEVARVAYNGAGQIQSGTTEAIAPYYTGLGESGFGIATSHTGIWTTGSTSSTDINTPEFRRYLNTSPFFQESRYSPSQKHVFTSLATVLAPEPGTLLAIGAGVAALLRRRKARD